LVESWFYCTTYRS